MKIEIFVSIVFGILVIILISYFIGDAIAGKRIELNFSKGKIYGWYDGHILYTDYIDIGMSLEEIEARKKKANDSLDQLIEKYNKIK